MSEIQFFCPYCNEKNWLEIEGMDEYDKYKENCSKCKREFEYRVEFSVDGYTDKIEEIPTAETYTLEDSGKEIKQ